MKIKRYFAADMRTAMRQVREDQGPDAVILSSRKVDGGVELMTAVDMDSLLAEYGVSTTPAPRAEERTAAAPASDQRLDGMQREITSLRGVLEQQLTGLAWGEMGRRFPRRALLIRRLREMGLSGAMSQRIAAAVPEEIDPAQMWRQALAQLAHHVHDTHDDILTQGGVVALVGPTGVGKTTTVAKLAARWVLRHGARDIALVTTDDQRIGAHEQLKIYGRILGVPVRYAPDAAALRAAVAELGDRRLVLIDTAGLSQRDGRLQDQAALVRAAGPLLRCYLTLAATAQFDALEETMRSFAAMVPAGAIITKVDESTSLGGVLSVLASHHLPVAYVSEGQRVPEDLRPARSHALVSRAVSLVAETRRKLSGSTGHHVYHKVSNHG